MPTPKQPEKRSELRSAPPSAGQSAPPPSAKGPAPGGSFTMPSATGLGDARAVARAPSAGAIDRAKELLRQMTIEEKAMQLSSVFPLALFDTTDTNRGQLDALLEHGIGHVSALGLIGHKTPETLAKSVNAIQRYLVTETRLKIPAIFHNEAMSGVVAPHFTAFPTSIGLAATWDPTATEEMADIIRRQMRAVGMLQALAPVMDVARDARWGG
jgi:beta-xylosidase